MAAGMNPFRRKHMQVLGLDDASFVSSRTSRSSEDGSSTISHFSDRASAHSAHSRTNSVKKTSGSLHDSNIDEYSDDGDGDCFRDENGRSLSYSGYTETSPTDTEGNPFDDEEEDDSLDELEGKPMGLRRRRTVPSKVDSVLGADGDNPWRTSTRIGNHPSHRRGDQDSTQVPLKAQKTLGLAKAGHLTSQEDYRRSNSLSPGTENVAPKAQRMLGIPSNPFQKPRPALAGGHLFHDELERHGSKGPTSLSKKVNDVDELQRMIMAGRRNFRDSTSTADVSSLSRDSMLSSNADTHIETPRSSQELLSRPPLTRIATDSLLDTSANLSEPWQPVEIGDSSPVALNKPLPKTPAQAFELAGSEPTQSTRHAGHAKGSSVPDPIAELHSHPHIAEMPAEMPAEPVIYELAASEATPGSSAFPIELPAREASPVDPPFQSRSQHTAFSQLKSAPQPPVPRRTASQRSSHRQGSNESFKSAAQHLTPQRSDSSLQRANRVPLSRSNSQRVRAAPSLTRSTSSRVDRFVTGNLPSASVSTPENISVIPATPNMIDPPAPPPSRPLPAVPGSFSARPITPTGSRPRANTNPNSPQSRLPPLQTTPVKTETPQGTPIADSMVSAVSTHPSDIISPGAISTLSPSSPASRRTGLNLIVKSAGNKDRESKEAKKLELKRDQNHQREWSWEPGKIDRIDSVKAQNDETIDEEPQREESEEHETIENRDEEASENDTELDRSPAESSNEDTSPRNINTLSGMSDIKRDIDEAIKLAQSEGGIESATVDSEKHNIRDSQGDSDKEIVGAIQEPEQQQATTQGSKMPEGNWI